MSIDTVDVFADEQDHQEPAKEQGPPPKIPPKRPHVDFPRFPHRGAWGWQDEKGMADALAALEETNPVQAAETRTYLAGTDEDPLEFFTQRGPLDPTSDHRCRECEIEPLATQRQARLHTLTPAPEDLQPEVLKAA